MPRTLQAQSGISINHVDSVSGTCNCSDLVTNRHLSNQQNNFPSQQSPPKLQLQQSPPSQTNQHDLYQTDSNYSCVSFQDNLLDQHIFTLGFLLQKLQNSYFKSYAINFDDPIKSDPELVQLQFQDYLIQRGLLKGQHFCQTFLQIISKQHKLRKFLSWIYDSSHQIYLPDLILIFQKIVIYHQHLKQIALSWNQLVQLASSPQFIISIFRDDSLASLNYQKLEQQRANSQGEGISEAYFMRFYALTVLLVLENYFNHPLYEQVKQIKRKELQERYNQKKRIKSALSKKIKKNHPSKGQK